MSRAPAQKHLRVAAVWGTQVLAVRHLRPGEALRIGEGPGALIAPPEGASVPEEPLRPVGSSWELDPRGASGGLMRLRGRDEDPAQLAAAGTAIPLVATDHGLLQYGQFALFFQFTDPVRLAAGRPRLDLGLVAAFATAVFSVGGVLLALKQVHPEGAMPKPLELTDAAELTRRLRLPPVVPPEPETSGGGAAKPDPSPAGGKPMAGAEGKLGKRGQKTQTKIPGNRPGLGGMSEVLSGSVGQEVQATLGSIGSVAAALGGLGSDQLVLGQGSGTGLRGNGPGGGGDGAGVPYGAGTLDTGTGAGKGAGGPGGGGRGLGSGSGTGAGTGAGTSERQISAAKAAAPGQGLSPDAIQRVVMSRYGAFRACYESAAAHEPNLSGSVSVAFRIAPGGGVQSASIASSSLGNPRIEGCMLRQIKRLQFPAADKGTSASFPFAFKPSKR